MTTSDEPTDDPRFPPLFCEVCAAPAAYLSVEGWCTCREHFSTPKPAERIFWFRTGERLDEGGIAPSRRPMNRWSYARNSCEVCGAYPGANCSVEGWSTCDEHFRTPKPVRPLFDHRTGLELGPYADLPEHERPGDFLPPREPPS